MKSVICIATEIDTMGIKHTNMFDLYDSISVNADVPGSEGDSMAARPASMK